MNMVVIDIISGKVLCQRLAAGNENGLMSSGDKTKLDGIKLATSSEDGLMSSAEKVRLGGIEENANHYVHPPFHPVSIFVQDSNNRLTTDAEKHGWSNKYTRNEADNKFSLLLIQVKFKEAVQTFAGIATTYPLPELGWNVLVKSEGCSYTYNGSEWVNTGGNTPLATSSINGLMSSSDKAQFDILNRTLQVLADAPTITWDVWNGYNAIVTLGGNRVLAFSNIQGGQSGTLIVKQDDIGFRTITLPRGLGKENKTLTLNPTPNGVDILKYFYDGTDYYWRIESYLFRG